MRLRRWVCRWKEIERFVLNFGSKNDRTCLCANIEKQKARVSHTFEARDNSKLPFNTKFRKVKLHLYDTSFQIFLLKHTVAVG